MTILLSFIGYMRQKDHFMTEESRTYHLNREVQSKLVSYSGAVLKIGIEVDWVVVII